MNLLKAIFPALLVGVLLDTKLSELSRLAQILEAFADGPAPVPARA